MPLLQAHYLVARYFCWTCRGEAPIFRGQGASSEYYQAKVAEDRLRGTGPQLAFAFESVDGNNQMVERLLDKGKTAALFYVETSATAYGYFIATTHRFRKPLPISCSRPAILPI
ncbi:MAG: hypothetical protein WBD75_13120 [Phycisphaerae bacterium]